MAEVTGETVDLAAAVNEKLRVEDERIEDPLSDERIEQIVPGVKEDTTLRESLHLLRDLQTEHDQVFADYLREKQEMEERFDARFAPLFQRRQARLKDHPVSLFWFKAFEHCEVLRENITDKDAVALKFLIDVSCESINALQASRPDGRVLPIGSFVLSFRFADNPFFENDVLTKAYHMHEEDFEELDYASGTKILWKSGKDLTVRTMKKKTKNGRVLIKKQPTDSFFNFFSPPQGISEEDSEDPQLLEELEDVVDADYELGECIRSEVIPKALLYYLNIAEAAESDDGDSEDDDGEDNDDAPNGRGRDARSDDDDDDSADDDEGDRCSGNKCSGLPPAAQSAEECKQQ